MTEADAAKPADGTSSQTDLEGDAGDRGLLYTRAMDQATASERPLAKVMSAAQAEDAG